MLVSKYCDRTPLYLRSQIFVRHGVDLARSTLVGWVDGACRWSPFRGRAAAIWRMRSATLFRDGRGWRDARREYGPPKTLHGGWKRWGAKGVFARATHDLPSGASVAKAAMTDAACQKAHRISAMAGMHPGSTFLFPEFEHRFPLWPPCLKPA
ncbi:IS66 family transposase [Paracoccus sp. (in: a-proteobacteria)]|uniref:IS66 family transposase n=1 Tax=Paracoccus sp. TaxID=267 RepID=UPI0039E2152F